jgi:hypothetical protein
MGIEEVEEVQSKGIRNIFDKIFQAENFLNLGKKICPSKCRRPLGR